MTVKRDSLSRSLCAKIPVFNCVRPIDALLRYRVKRKERHAVLWCYR